VTSSSLSNVLIAEPSASLRQQQMLYGSSLGQEQRLSSRSCPEVVASSRSLSNVMITAEPSASQKQVGSTAAVEARDLLYITYNLDLAPSHISIFALVQVNCSITKN